LEGTKKADFTSEVSIQGQFSCSSEIDSICVFIPIRTAWS